MENLFRNRRIMKYLLLAVAGFRSAQHLPIYAIINTHDFNCKYGWPSVLT